MPLETELETLNEQFVEFNDKLAILNGHVDEGVMTPAEKATVSALSGSAAFPSPSRAAAIAASEGLSPVSTRS